VAGSMGFVITLSALLIGGAVVGVVAQRRAQRSRPSASGLSGLDAEAEANHWLVRLGGGLVPPDARAWAGADEAAGRSLTSAAECHRAARAQLAGARTAGEYAEVTRVAREGLEHLRSARTALGIDSDVAVSMPPHAVRVSAVGGSCAVTSR
jgi:hypothetical protein